MKKLIFLLFLVPLFVGCEDDNNSVSDDDRIYGEWNGKYQKTRFMFVDDTYTDWGEYQSAFGGSHIEFFENGIFKNYSFNLGGNYEVKNGVIKYNYNNELSFTKYNIKNDSLILFSEMDLSDVGLWIDDRIVYDTLKIRETQIIHYRVK